jgi:biotin carboxyl carrier protein
MRNKIPLAPQATSGNLPPQQQATKVSHGAPALPYACILYANARGGRPENAMPDIKITTEVAGRICALPIEAGASVVDGDDIAFVEAMKMEIPVAAPAAGKLKSILVKLDDVVAEGQAIAVLAT